MPATRTTIVERLRAAGCVFAEDEARLLVEAAQSSDELARLVEQRVSGIPIEHLLGWAEFCGLRIAVDPGVFVPRRRTELVVHQATAHGRAGTVVVDLCCGSGAVGAALAAAPGEIELYAVDIDPDAVACARRNIAATGGRAEVGDLDEPLPIGLEGRVDLLIANAPYVPSTAIETMPPEARLHEHRVALDGGSDGLDVLRRIVQRAPRWLAPSGHLIVETSEAQAPVIATAMAERGLRPEVVTSAELDATVVTGARRTLAVAKS